MHPSIKQQKTRIGQVYTDLAAAIDAVLPKSVCFEDVYQKLSDEFWKAFHTNDLESCFNIIARMPDPKVVAKKVEV